MNKAAILSLILAFAFFTSCDSDDPTIDTTPEDYTGSASVTQGVANTTNRNLYAKGQRVAGLGTITSADGKSWTVPADVSYEDNAFPFAPDLYNPDGTQHSSAAEALAAFDNADIVDIDGGSELITGYIFADNYFELYVNGVPVGKDAIPFTQFNSHIVQFRASRPYTIAMKLVDWEENLGLGSEDNQGNNYHPGDGGLVAVFKDASNNTVAVTNNEWKAQTYYTAPIKDLTCPEENGTVRSTENCDANGVSDGSRFFGLHWQLPSNWMDEDFDDSNWPAATTYTNNTIGVDNKKAYTNFTNVFDDITNDAQFIWSRDVILDNEVIVRYRVE